MSISVSFTVSRKLDLIFSLIFEGGEDTSRPTFHCECVLGVLGVHYLGLNLSNEDLCNYLVNIAQLIATYS